MTLEIIMLVAFAAFLTLILLEVPIGLAIALSGILGVALQTGMPVASSSAPTRQSPPECPASGTRYELKSVATPVRLKIGLGCADPRLWHLTVSGRSAS